MKFLKTALLLALGLFLLLVLSQSCYTVRIASKDAVPTAESDNGREDYFRNKLVVEMDTTITIGVADKDFTMLLDCGIDGFQTVEYRNTLGGVLLSGITFGRKRRVRIKYVCVKPQN